MLILQFAIPKNKIVFAQVSHYDILLRPLRSVLFILFVCTIFRFFSIFHSNFVLCFDPISSRSKSPILFFFDVFDSILCVSVCILFVLWFVALVQLVFLVKFKYVFLFSWLMRLCLCIVMQSVHNCTAFLIFTLCCNLFSALI